jgi:hypothetical protein
MDSTKKVSDPGAQEGRGIQVTGPIVDVEFAGSATPRPTPLCR